MFRGWLRWLLILLISATGGIFRGDLQSAWPCIKLPSDQDLFKGLMEFSLLKRYTVWITFFFQFQAYRLKKNTKKMFSTSKCETWGRLDQNVPAFDLCECAQKEKYIQMKYIMNERGPFERNVVVLMKVLSVQDHGNSKVLYLRQLDFQFQCGSQPLQTYKLNWRRFFSVYV